MEDIPRKTKPEGEGRYVIHTIPWQAVVDFYRERSAGGVPVEPLLWLAETIRSSAVAPRLYVATSMLDLLVSDSREFGSGDGTLRISYRATEHQFEFRHRTFSDHDEKETCSETEVLQKLKPLLRLKYGVLLELPEW